MPEQIDPPHTRLRGFVTRPTLAEYAERCADHFVLHRADGILHVRMHSDDGPALYSVELHNAWGQLWTDLGNDPGNEVIIFSGTGSSWIAGIAPSSFTRPFPDWSGDEAYELYRDGMRVVENLVMGIDVPTIGVVNGPGFHTELALLCDITLAADTAIFSDGHFAAGQAPGDGLQLALQALLGPKRAAYALYTGEQFDAQRALELGLVNEVLPADLLLPRAREIAESIMRKPRPVRRLTHAIAQRPVRRRLLDDHGYGMAHELFGAFTDRHHRQ